MATSREGPNPLRPYYIPPSVGSPTDASQNVSHAASLGSKYPSTSTNSLGSSARNILADMDYSGYISNSSPSATGVMRNLLEQAIWKYSSVFLAQPFEVAKTVLQVQVAGPRRTAGAKIGLEDDMRKRPGNYRRESYESYDVASPTMRWFINTNAWIACFRRLGSRFAVVFYFLCTPRTYVQSIFKTAAGTQSSRARWCSPSAYSTAPTVQIAKLSTHPRSEVSVRNFGRNLLYLGRGRLLGHMEGYQ